MKKTLLTVAVFCGCILSAYAQPSGFRNLRPAEIEFLGRTQLTLYNAIPHEYNNWKGLYDGPVDVLQHWCGGEPGCSGIIPGSVGAGDPYSMAFAIEFRMAGASSDSMAGASMSMIKDFNNGAQLAAAQKFMARTTLKIYATCNIIDGDYALGFCGLTPLEKIDLPVPAAFAMIAKRTTDCPIMEDGRTSMHGDYYDNALIVLGKPLTKKSTEKGSDGLTTSRYSVGFDHAKIGKLVAQNIVITFKGDAEDIKAYVKTIDWQKLYDLLQK